MAGVRLERVSKEFPGRVRAVHDLTLTIASGEFMVLVGPSGCGKSTILRMIAGLEEVTEGRILIGERDVTHLAPRDRDVAMVFQNYALYPHMTVRQNLAYPLKVRRAPRHEIRRRVEEVSRMLGLEGLLDRRPASLSGGQRQRVAMGRAIIRRPRVFLMDEPLSNLDAKLRVAMRAELARLHERLGVTTVYVTHDQVEAMTLGQRVAVLDRGRIQQVDTPQEIYRRPANLFVAAFIGSPPMNLVQALLDRDHVVFGGLRLRLPPDRRPAATPAGGRVVLGIRPDSFQDAAFAPAGLPRLAVVAEVVEDLGSEAHVIFPVDAPSVAPGGSDLVAEDLSEILPVGARRSLLVARVDPRTRARVGERVELAVDPSRFHFFDPVTGQAIPIGAPADVSL